MSNQKYLYAIFCTSKLRVWYWRHNVQVTISASDMKQTLSFELSDTKKIPKS